MRGRFYVFLLYDVHNGKVHWAFYPGKDSTYVCRFMQRVRRWYPQQEVWIGLDQDPTHPCKSKKEGYYWRLFRDQISRRVA